MTQPYNTERIYAVATAAGVAPVAIVRVSGPNLMPLATQLAATQPKPRYAHLVHLCDNTGQTIDHALLLYFPAPASLTGEDVLEIQTHGSPAVLDWLGERLQQLGCRQAQAGEFSLRALLNGKLDLLQAEATADLINARTRRALTSAQQAIDGGMRDWITALHTQVTEIRVQIESALDFTDEDISLEGMTTLRTRLTEIADTLDQARRAGQRGLMLHSGVRVAIIGAPNVGKSTLINTLASRSVALVSEQAGTTRDALSELVDLNGIQILFTDTAGLRTHSDDPIERLGMQRSQEQAASAHLILLLRETGQPASPSLQECANQWPDIPVILVRTKIDLEASAISSSQADETPPHPTTKEVAISAPNQIGIESLKDHILQTVGLANSDATPRWARQRHLQAIARAHEEVQQAHQNLHASSLERAAEHLRTASQHMEELLGKTTADDLLGSIFSTFCIGK